MDDGDVQSKIVKQVLSAHGVDVSSEEGSDMTILAKGEVIETHRFGPYCSRRFLHYLQRKFEIPIHHFYNPHMVLPPTKEIC